MTRSPYKVGMARPNQRYIEPDAIYPDLRSAGRVQSPAYFPFTWTPVNGLGDASASIQSTNPVNDLLNVISDVGQGAAGGAGDVAGQQMEDFLDNNPAGKVLLDKVQSKAQDGVVAVVKKNAPDLIMLAVAGGAVGGALSAKMGKAGTLFAIGIAIFAARKLMSGT